MAIKTTTPKETKVATKKCATKKTCAKKTEAKAVAPKKTCTTKKACAKKETKAADCTSKKTCSKKATEVKTPKKACTKKACKKNAVNKELSESKLTMVLAKIDIGFGNNLYLRGEGAGLSWEKGVLMQSVSDNEWLWEIKGIEGELSFKFLINDEVWCNEENFAGTANEINTYYPSF